MTLSSFSQTDTTKILLSKPVAKLVIKDLIRCDGLKVEKHITDSILYNTQQNIIDRDTIISKQTRIISNLNKQYDDSHQMYLGECQNSKYYSDQLNKQKQTTWLVGGSGILAVILTILILK